MLIEGDTMKLNVGVIFGGKSLKDRWHDVYLCEIGGIDSREFIKMIAEEYPIES